MLGGEENYCIITTKLANQGAPKALLTCVVGESLFTLFASLTYAYHYLMTLIK